MLHFKEVHYKKTFEVSAKCFIRIKFFTYLSWMKLKFVRYPCVNKFSAENTTALWSLETIAMKYLPVWVTVRLAGRVLSCRYARRNSYNENVNYSEIFTVGVMLHAHNNLHHIWLDRYSSSCPINKRSSFILAHDDKHLQICNLVLWHPVANSKESIRFYLLLLGGLRMLSKKLHWKL